MNHVSLFNTSLVGDTINRDRFIVFLNIYPSSKSNEMDTKVL